MKIATDVKTADWNSIVEGLREDGWKMSNKYLGFDAGIDYDFLVLRKGENSIEFAWGNWFEGEIKAEEELLQMIQEKFTLRFSFGEATLLDLSESKPGGLQRLINWFRKK